MNAKVIGRAILLLGCLISAGAQAATCDRACMTGLLTQYVDAVVAHDHTRLPLTADVRYTEDSRLVKLGDGLWKSVTGKGTFRHDYLDTRRQIAAAHVQLREGETHVLLSVLLHLKDSRIAGIETLMQRLDATSRFQPTELGKPMQVMDDPVPAGKRMSREKMIKTALTYTEGLRVGSFIDAKTPFSAKSYRIENGIIAAGPGCRSEECGMFAQRQIVHPGIIPSVAAVDEEKGVVLLWMNFGWTGPSTIGEGKSWVVFEAFKIWGGEIHGVLAFFPALPVNTSRFWPTADDLPRWAAY